MCLALKRIWFRLFESVYRNIFFFFLKNNIMIGLRYIGFVGGWKIFFFCAGWWFKDKLHTYLEFFFFCLATYVLSVHVLFEINLCVMVFGNYVERNNWYGGPFIFFIHTFIGKLCRLLCYRISIFYSDYYLSMKSRFFFADHLNRMSVIQTPRHVHPIKWAN